MRGSADGRQDGQAKDKDFTLFIRSDGHWEQKSCCQSLPGSLQSHGRNRIIRRRMRSAGLGCPVTGFNNKHISMTSADMHLTLSLT